MIYRVKFMSLEGQFRTVCEKNYGSFQLAFAAIVAYATDNDFSNVKDVLEEFHPGIRFTADPLKGRKGRNIAFLDEVPEEGDDQHPW